MSWAEGALGDMCTQVTAWHVHSTVVHHQQIIFEVPAYDTNPYFFTNLAAYSDLILLVFKSNYSNRKNIDLLINEIKTLGLKHVQGVLNVINKNFV